VEAVSVPFTFTWPILPPPSSTQGQLFGAVRGTAKPHTGLDMGTGGDAVLATADATVLESRDTKDARGQMIRLLLGTDENGDAWEVYYMHLASRGVAKGDAVESGQPIAVAGMTGLPKPWPHLHFEVRKNNVPLDPLSVLSSKESTDGGLGWIAAAATLLLFI
jgi:murein DD-endopeptidase MepM/ murein hydrolase activator NlpD